jgi:hypothetical protein
MARLVCDGCGREFYSIPKRHYWAGSICEGKLVEPRDGVKDKSKRGEE